ncbi:MAG TPA: hypothetical protein VFP84_02690 [Kofleriaceae bacterium]|nr:hypothetical protein [Kofleriaceae bacterium]
MIAQVLTVAEREFRRESGARPWEADLPSPLPAARHTVTLDERSEQRLEDLRQAFHAQGPAGVAVLKSTVVARAIAIAEAPILAMTSDEIELHRVRSDAFAITEEVAKLEQSSGEDVIAELVTKMKQVAKLFTRAQCVQQRAVRSAGRVRLEAADLISGTLNELMIRTGEAIRRARREADRGGLEHQVGGERLGSDG